MFSADQQEEAHFTELDMVYGLGASGLGLLQPAKGKFD
jgi:hypothetical protein